MDNIDEDNDMAIITLGASNLTQTFEKHKRTGEGFLDALKSYIVDKHQNKLLRLIPSSNIVFSRKNVTSNMDNGELYMGDFLVSFYQLQDDAKFQHYQVKLELDENRYHVFCMLRNIELKRFEIYDSYGSLENEDIYTTQKLGQRFENGKLMMFSDVMLLKKEFIAQFAKTINKFIADGIFTGYKSTPLTVDVPNGTNGFQLEMDEYINKRAPWLAVYKGNCDIWSWYFCDKRLEFNDVTLTPTQIHHQLLSELKNNRFHGMTDYSLQMTIFKDFQIFLQNVLKYANKACEESCRISKLSWDFLSNFCNDDGDKQFELMEKLDDIAYWYFHEGPDAWFNRYLFPLELNESVIHATCEFLLTNDQTTNKYTLRIFQKLIVDDFRNQFLSSFKDKFLTVVIRTIEDANEDNVLVLLNEWSKFQIHSELCCAENYSNSFDSVLLSK